MNSDVFTPDRDQQIEAVRVGVEQQPLLRVDSLFAGVDLIKEFAISKNQFVKADSFYPGVRMEIPADYSIAVLKILAPYIFNFFKLDLRHVKKIASRFSIVTTPPQDLTLMQKIPHFDAPNPRSLAMVYYLCDAADSGTALYRHKASGYEYVDEYRYQPYLEQVRYQFKDAQPQGYICGSTNEYEQIASYQAKYNRLIAYHGSSLHSGIITPGYNFDANPRTGRLTVTTFVEFD